LEEKEMAKKEETIVEIKPLDIKRVNIRIVGDTPLIVHRWSEKAKKEILDKQMKTTKTKGKDARDPYDDFIQSLYWLENKPEISTPDAFEEAVKNGAKWGFPTNSIKQAGNSAAYRLGWVKNQMSLRSTYFITSEYGELAEIKGSIPRMREDSVKIGMGTSDLRYRGEFENWYMDLTLEYNASGDITLEQILNIINVGGYGCGLGEWRPERDGINGRYHVDTI
jgi:hypothetical protein